MGLYMRTGLRVMGHWDSTIFTMLRIKDRKGQVLTFFFGLRGYEVLAAIAEEKMRANKTSLPTGINSTNSTPTALP